MDMKPQELDEILAFWRTLPAHSNERLAVDIIDGLRTQRPEEGLCVPAEPTLEMIQAFFRGAACEDMKVIEPRFYSAYRAMLEASKLPQKLGEA